jgi:hypothetical protein
VRRGIEGACGQDREVLVSNTVLLGGLLRGWLLRNLLHRRRLLRGWLLRGWFLRGCCIGGWFLGALLLRRRLLRDRRREWWLRGEMLRGRRGSRLRGALGSRLLARLGNWQAVGLRALGAAGTAAGALLARALAFPGGAFVRLP